MIRFKILKYEEVLTDYDNHFTKLIHSALVVGSDCNLFQSGSAKNVVNVVFETEFVQALNATVAFFANWASLAGIPLRYVLWSFL